MTKDIKKVSVPYIDRHYFNANQYGETFRLKDENGNPITDENILDQQFNLIAIQASKSANAYVQKAIQICGGVDTVGNANGISILNEWQIDDIKQAIAHLVGDYYRGSRPYYERIATANLQSGTLSQSQGNIMYQFISFKLSAEVKQLLNNSMVIETSKGIQVGIATTPNQYWQLNTDNLAIGDNTLTGKNTFKDKTTLIPLATEDTDITNLKSVKNEIQKVVNTFPERYIFQTYADSQVGLDRAKTGDTCRIINDVNIDPNQIYECVIDGNTSSATYGQKIWNIKLIQEETSGVFFQLLPNPLSALDTETTLLDSLTNYDSVQLTYKHKTTGEIITGATIPVNTIILGTNTIDYGRATLIFVDYSTVKLLDTDLILETMFGQTSGSVLIADLANVVNLDGAQTITGQKTFNEDILIQNPATTDNGAIRKLEFDTQNETNNIRFISIEEINVEQNTRLDNIEIKNTEQDIDITTLERKTTMVEYFNNLSEWDGTVDKWEDTVIWAKDPLVVEGAYQKDFLLLLRKIKRADGSIGFENLIRGGLVLWNGIDDQPFIPLYEQDATTKKYVDDLINNKVNDIESAHITRTSTGTVNLGFNIEDYYFLIIKVIYTDSRLETRSIPSNAYSGKHNFERILGTDCELNVSFSYDSGTGTHIMNVSTYNDMSSIEVFGYMKK